LPGDLSPERRGAELLAPLLTTDELLAATGDRAWLQAMLDVEAGLAAAQARIGLVPAEAAEAIAACCDAGRFDPAALGRAARSGGNPVIPLAAALRDAVPEPARDWVHHGATSQDILDTAAMLVTRDVLALVAHDLRRLADGAADLADTHRDTLMAGRTLGQQALPVPFGLKAAGWLAAALDAIRLVDGLGPRLAVQLGGAAGTLAALGDDGPAVTAGLAGLLGLAEPLLPWHTARQRIAEIAGVLGTVAGTGGKVALDVALGMQTEIGELAEPAAPGRGGSSTMPHKRNPVLAAEVLAAARRAHGLVPVLQGSLLAEHERAAGAWHAEWEALADLLRLAGGAAAGAAEIVSGLEVDPVRMAANLDRTGVLLAERVTFALVPRLGRATAAQRVGDAAARARATQGSFRDELLADPGLGLDPATLDDLLDPRGYLGSSAAFIDRVLAEHRRMDTEHEEAGRAPGSGGAG
jgi:3-carboxy-cis,cis-muconate cycloisomerase